MTALTMVLVAALAIDPLDVPLALRPANQHPATEVKAGQLMPFDGLCLDETLAVATGKRIASCEETLKAAQKDTLVSVPLFVAVIAATLAVGLGVGFAVRGATNR